MCDKMKPMCVVIVGQGGWLIAGLSLLLGAGQAWANPYYAIPDAELMVAEFQKIYGDSTLSSKTDTPGPGVRFGITFASSGDGKLGVGDKWPINLAAGLGDDPKPPGTGHTNQSLWGYSGIRMTVAYLSGPANSNIDIALIMNTGLTGSSGYPSNDGTNDTFWGGSWVSLGLGEIKTLSLEFTNAEAWNIYDNKAPHTGGGLKWPNGGKHAINERDLHEVSNIGFQIADFDGDARGQSIAIGLNVVPAPGAALLVALGVGLIAWAKRRFA